MNRHKTNNSKDHGIAIFTVAVTINILLIATSLSVDVGRTWVKDQELQRAADIAALEAARFLSGAYDTPEQLQSAVAAQAISAAGRNGFAINQNAVQVGHIVNDEWVPASTPGSTWPPSAVAVRVDATTPWLFRPGNSDRERSAVAKSTPIATVMIGSELARVSTEHSQIFGLIMADLLRSNAYAEITAISWSGLADIGISLQELEAAATAGGIGNYLNTELSIGEHFHILAQALDNKGVPAAAAAVDALSTLAGNAGPLSPIRLSDLIAISPPSNESSLDTGIQVLDLVHGIALLGAAKGPAVITNTQFDYGHVANVSAQTHIIEPPQVAIGTLGATAATAQASVILDINVSIVEELTEAVTSSVTGAISDLGLGLTLRLLGLDLQALLGVILDPLLAELGTIDLSLAVDAAGATAQITGIACTPNDLGYVDLLASTRLASITEKLWSIETGINIANNHQAIRQLPPFNWEHRTLVLGNNINLVGDVIPEIDSLVSNILGGTLNGLLSPLLTPTTDAVRAVISTALNPIQANLIEPILTSLGVHLGNASTAVLAVHCNNTNLIK